MLVSNGFAIGMLVPKYDVVGSGTDSYEFAIDFGTTNTHVEYRVNNGQVTHPLEMSQSDSTILAMHTNDSSYQELFEQKEIDDFMNAPVQEFCQLPLALMKWLVSHYEPIYVWEKRMQWNKGKIF